MRDIARAVALLLAGIVVACSGPGATPPNPTAVLRQAGQAMSGVHSLGADVTFGPGVVLQGLTLSSATTQIQLPGESDTVFKVKQGDFLVDLRVVSTNGHLYVRLPFSQFTEATPDEARAVPDLTKLFDATSGLPAVLPAGTNTRFVDSEQMSGVDADKIATTYTADQIGQLLGGGIRPAGDVQATIWVATSDHYVRRVILSGPLLQAGKNVQVQIDLHDFNKPVTIANPTTTG